MNISWQRTKDALMAACTHIEKLKSEGNHTDDQLHRMCITFIYHQHYRPTHRLSAQQDQEINESGLIEAVPAAASAVTTLSKAQERADEIRAVAENQATWKASFISGHQDEKHRSADPVVTAFNHMDGSKHLKGWSSARLTRRTGAEALQNRRYDFLENEHTERRIFNSPLSESRRHEYQ